MTIVVPPDCARPWSAQSRLWLPGSHPDPKTRFRSGMYCKRRRGGRQNDPRVYREPTVGRGRRTFDERSSIRETLRTREESRHGPVGPDPAHVTHAVPDIADRKPLEEFPAPRFGFLPRLES